MEIGTRIRHKYTGKLGTVIDYPTEFLDAVSVRWDEDGPDAWPCGYVAFLSNIEKVYND